MKNALLIAKNDFTRVLRSKMLSLAIIVIILLPLIYGFLYLWAFWDPYGNLSGIPMAIVNLDKGGYREGEYKNAGNDLVQQMLDSGNVSWSLVSYDKALSGLESKKYYGIIIIPENFTRQILSVENANPHNATLYFRARDANNYLGSRITREVANEIEKELNENITGQYIDNALPKKDELLSKLSDGSDAANEISDGIMLIQRGSSALNSGTKRLYSGSQELSEGIDAAADGADTLSQSSQQLYYASSSVSSGMKSFEAVMSALQAKGCIDSTTYATYAKLEAGMQQVAAGQKQLSQGAASLSDGMEDLSDGADKLEAGLKQGSEGTNELRVGLMMVYSGADQLSIELGDKVSDIQENLSDDRVRDTVDQVVHPVSLEDISTDEFSNYGTALSPYFVQLALWVGCLVLLLIISPKDNRLTVSRFSAFDITLGKTIFPVVVAMLQAIVLDFSMVFFLGFSVASLPLFIAFTILLSWTFLAIVQFIIFIMGKAGEIPAIILLMLQLTSAGGTFPVETSHKFFQVIHHFLPMSYGISALREIILGGSMLIVAEMAGVILAFLIAFFILRMLFLKRKLKYTDIYPLLDI